MASQRPRRHPEKRGFLGRAGMERKLNFGCLVVLLAFATLFYIARVYLAPGDIQAVDPTKQSRPR